MWKPTTLCFISIFCIIQAQNLPRVTLSDKGLITNLKDNGAKIGAFIVENLGPDYQKAVENLIEKAPVCLEKHEDLPRLPMLDGSIRTTFAYNGQNLDCLDLNLVTKTFDKVDDFISDMIDTQVGHRVTYKDPQNDTLDLKSSPKKEHLHVYSARTENSEHWMVPFHLDNGLYLIITPYPGHGLKIMTSTGSIIDTDAIPTHSVLVLMGKGLTDWLLPQSTQFFAVPHAVEKLSLNSKDRTVFARMKVAPLEAEQKIKFQDVFFNQDKVLVKREEHFVQDTSKIMCEEGEAYCWMQECMPQPTCHSGEILSCYSTTNNITCCSDPNEKCDVMDPTCKWECVDEPPHNNTNDFCYGGMDMLMTGFETTKGLKPCIILFFKEWTLDDPFKFAIGCIGVGVLGFSIELLISIRRKISSRQFRLTRLARRLLVVTLFGLNLVLGYLAMLVAMTYSIELFLCVVLGLCVGHFVFNSKADVGESVDPCCASQQNHNNSQQHVPLSRTPCDQEVRLESEDSENQQHVPAVVVNLCENSVCSGSNGSARAHDQPPPYNGEKC